ncbi:MAG TPA: TssN family type VI secretion system protein, partial [Cytophagaceae bacterium]
MDKRILIASALFLGISIGIFIILANAIKGFLKNKNRVLVYCLISIVIFSLTALLGYEGLIEDPMDLLITFQVCFLLYGIGNYLSIKHFFDWSESKSFLDKLGFTLFLSFISLIPFLLVLKMVNDQEYYFIMLTSVILFLTPLFFFR